MSGSRTPQQAPTERGPQQRWLAAPHRPPFGPRSVLLDVTARVLTPTALVLSVYLLLAGHYSPGGGFTGGLVAGMAFVLRYLAGGRRELGAANLVPPAVLLGGGLLVSGATAAAPLAFGAAVLESATVEGTLPVIGHIKLVTSVFFDVGIYVLVLGLVLSALRALGVQVEREEYEEESEEGGSA